MIDTERFPFSDEDLAKIENSIINYKRFAKITIEFWPDLTDNPDLVTVRISQTDIVNGLVLSEEELTKRGKEVFEGTLPHKFILKYLPETYAKYKLRA